MLSGVSEVNYDLNPGQTEICILGVGVASSAPAGKYPLTLYFLDSGTSIEKYDLEIEVLSISDIRLTIDYPNPFAVNTTQISLTHTVENQGNIPVPLRFEIYGDKNIPISVSESKFRLEPDETISVTTDIFFDDKTYKGDHYVFIKIYNAETGELFEQKSFNFEVLASFNESVDPFHRIPGFFTLFNLCDYGRISWAFDIAGNGPLDPEGKRNLEFFFRLPSDRERNFFSKNEILFVGLSEEKGFLHLGDTIYTLSPLTEFFRYGRGIGAKYLFDPVEVAAFYIKQPSNQKIEHEEVGGSVAYWKDDLARVGINFLSKNEASNINSSIGSLQADVWATKDYHAYFEYGYNFKNQEDNGERQGCTGLFSGRILKSGWFTVEKNFAESFFYGYFNNLELTRGVLDIPLAHGWRYGLSGNIVKQKSRTYQDITSPEVEQDRYTTHLSYLAGNGINLVGSLKYIRFYNSDDSDHNFRQHWAGWDISIARRHYHIIGSVNLGISNDLAPTPDHEFLQRYFLNFSRQCRPDFFAFLQLESGNSDYFDGDKWYNTATGGIRYTNKQGHWCDLSLKKSINNPDSCSYEQVFFNFNYLFPNGHELNFGAEVYHCAEALKPIKYLSQLRYTIPLNFPAYQKKDRGTYIGRILHSSSLEPISYVVLNVEGQRVASDKTGAFGLNLPAGDYTVSVEAEELGSYTVGKQKIHVPGGATHYGDIYLQETGQLEGKLVIYDFPNTYENQIKLLEEGVQPEDLEEDLQSVSSIKGVRVTLTSFEQGMSLTTVTDSEGYFSFKGLPVANWLLLVEKDDIPKEFVINNNETEIEIRESQTKTVDVVCYPLVYQMLKNKKKPSSD